MAVSEEVRQQYKSTIGIECHVQLKTKTKLFSAVSNDARDAAANTLISHIDIALPGALPVLNKAAIELASRAALALNTRPQKYSYFERKHYFYPDSPMGYQISQLHAPIIMGGSVEIEVNGQKKTIRINRAQLEADAGKNTHPEGADYTLVDFNRAGTPLLEIVSESDLNSATEAKAYCRELYLLMKYSGVSDVDLYHGNMRFDVNISVSKTDDLGLRTEVKNLNSFRSVENAVNYEIDRQIELLESGKEVIQETRGWDEAKQKTTTQRTKEEAHDYRYMPEPDIPPVELNEEFISNMKSSMPLLPSDIRSKLSGCGIDSKTVEDILEYPDIALYLIKVLENAGPKSVRYSAFLMLHLKSQDEKGESNLIRIHPDRIKKLTLLIDEGSLSSTAAREVYRQMLNNDEDPMAIAEELNLIQVSDEGELDKIVSEVLAQNSKAAEDIKKGEMKAIGFLVGQVMAKSQGKANPQLAQELIKKQLSL
jgi:aspartyl-tRNA(Asn)/glutamyl-tRNA(Gln) amidotransferase subunit B